MYVRREAGKVAMGRSRLSWEPKHRANGQLRRRVCMIISRMDSANNVLSRAGLSRRGRCARGGLLRKLFVEAVAVIFARRALHAALSSLITAHDAARSRKGW